MLNRLSLILCELPRLAQADPQWMGLSSLPWVGKQRHSSVGLSGVHDTAL